MALPCLEKGKELNVFCFLQMVDHIFPIQLTSAYTMDIILYPLVLCIKSLLRINVLGEWGVTLAMI